MHHVQAKVGHCTNHCEHMDTVEWKYFLLLHNYVKLLALNAETCSELSKTLEIFSRNCGQLVNNYEDTFSNR